MAAPTTVSTGLAYVLSIDNGSTVIGGGTNATLTQSQAITETTNKSSGVWKSGISGLRTWSLGFDGMYLVSSAEVPGTTLTLTAGGVTLKGMKTVSITLSADLLESASSSSTVALDRYIVPSTRSLSITVTGELYDFDLDSSPTGGDEGLEDIIDRIDGTAATSIAMILGFGSAQSIPFTARPTSFSVDTPHDGIMTYSVTLESVGTVAAPTSTGADAGIIAMFVDFFATAGVGEIGTAVLKTATTDRIQWSGAAYPETLTIDIDWTGAVKMSGTLQGSGPLTKAATA